MASFQISFQGAVEGDIPLVLGNSRLQFRGHGRMSCNYSAGLNTHIWTLCSCSRNAPPLHPERIEGGLRLAGDYRITLLI